jgi:glycosyltransferase involved in cell wall biosynthesis
MHDELISVIMPVYNGERYIGNALRSLLREDQVELDIIIVDDGSTDATETIVTGLAEANPTIRLVAGSHAGVTRARNAGLAAVKGACRYITFLDCDDLNAPGRIARQLRLLKENPEHDCVIGLMQFFEAADEELCRPVPGSRTETVRGVSLTATLFARSVFERLGGFNEEMQHGEDTDFFLRLLEARTPYLLDDEVAILYRRHVTNMTNDIARTRRGFMDAIRRSLARRRESGIAADLGDLFKARGAAEEMFRNGT